MMDEQVSHLFQKAWQLFGNVPPDERLIIGIAGIPGSGKTTLAKIITDMLNDYSLRVAPDEPAPAAFLPMDGFHLPRKQLLELPDPEEAIKRRGAAYTFSATRFLHLLQSLRLAPLQTCTAPSFDHKIKDPVEEDITILPTHRIVVVEGLYLTLDKDVWRDAANVFDEIWFVEVDREVARKRLRERHVRAGICETIEEGDKRAVENDLVNGEEILANKVRVDETVQSLEDQAWVHE